MLGLFKRRGKKETRPRFAHKKDLPDNAPIHKLVVVMTKLNELHCE